MTQRPTILFAAVAALVLSAWGLAPAADGVRRQGALVLDGVPDPSAEVRESLRPYQNIRSARFADWLPGDQGIAITTRFGNTTQVHRVAGPGGTRHQVTFYDEPVGRISFPRHGEAGDFLFFMDAGGNEVDQLFLFDMGSGKARMVSDGESVHRAAVWANTSRTIAYNSTARNGRDWDVYVRAADDATTAGRMLVSEGGYWSPVDWAPGDDQLLVSKYVSANESRLAVIDLASGAMRLIDGDDPPASYRSALFSEDGLGLYYTSDRDGEFHRLYYHDLKHDVSKAVTNSLGWDVQSFAMSPDGSRIAAVVNENGFGRLLMLDTNDLTTRRVEVPDGVLGGLEFDRGGSRLAMTVSTPTSPGDVYVMDVETDAIVRWTFSETGGVDPARFVGAEVVRYPTFDTLPDESRRTIPALLYRPAGDGPFPVVVDIHGGPEGQARPGFDAFTQFLATEMGVAVIRPNVRGSRGYGKSYLALDNGRLREDSVRDIGALLDWIERRPELDAARVLVMGGSYGGYMVLASMAHFPDRLAGGISVVGISNFVTFLESTGEYRRDLRRAEYGDESDPEMRAFLEEISPTTNADKITRPLFVAQGKNDPRVPYTEAEQIVGAVRANGQPVWYLLAEDEGHGFARKENRDVYQVLAAMFIDEILGAE